MTTKETLLIELGTEELPPKSLKLLSESFRQNIESALAAAGFEFSEVTGYGSPRRLAVSISECEFSQADSQVEKKGPSVSAAFDEKGNPTKAALGWAKANGISVSEAERIVTDKGEWLSYVANVKGKRLDSELHKIVLDALKKLPIPKAMRWGSGNSEFIRPVHTLCSMFGQKVLPIKVFGIESSNLISGHRFHGNQCFALDHASNYAEALKKEFVLASYKDRTSVIERDVKQKAQELGLYADYNIELLEEISSLVEWPVVLEASFEKSFLAVPKEALIYTMKDDQKYIPLVSSSGELSNSFLFVSNIESKDPSQVILGNEKVVRPRLADAKFFFDTDKKTTLEDTSKRLSSVLFQKELGTLSDKTKRLVQLSTSLATKLGYNSAKCERAAELAKADLLTNMVMEFTSIQGVMGKHYALYDGEDNEVALALEEQYLPRFSGDNLPTTESGIVLSLAEKMDTLVGIFGIGKIPKADKDPFALRRSAIGLLRILIDKKLPLEITQLIQECLQNFDVELRNAHLSSQLSQFIYDRFKPLLLEEGFKADEIDSVLSNIHRSQNAYEIFLTVQCVSEFRKSQQAVSLATAFKRVSNILNKNSAELVVGLKIDRSLIKNNAEKQIVKAIESVQDEYDTLRAKQDYLGALNALTLINEPLDEFFESTMIMVDEKEVRVNRLAILKKIRELVLGIADISYLTL